MSDKIYYSGKYYDDKYEYRHVVLPKEMVKSVPTTRLLREQEWRAMGVQQSQGWVHYMIHKPGTCHYRIYGYMCKGTSE
ncbi:cyclin-dependent kinases regulatory subunit-like isoform X2 [Osmia bicornis bicornis]|uniref:cyclin-dependent kinases regulatory subunit-like isoform X2 n=1 Tax=Osmia bicornis bicornis TaxID=1437191 RepID=UPI0010F77A6A|nr:cyclin-dependent kinases regulatory subunit-like isoform X2 [Osmia bicornis bicornis]